MDINGGLEKISGDENKINIPDGVLSDMDCSTSSKLELASLALQASQQP